MLFVSETLVTHLFLHFFPDMADQAVQAARDGEIIQICGMQAKLNKHLPFVNANGEEVHVVSTEVPRTVQNLHQLFSVRDNET